MLPDAFKGIKQIGVIGWGSQVNILWFFMFLFVNFSLCVSCLKFEVLDLYKLALFVQNLYTSFMPSSDFCEIINDFLCALVWNA